MERFNQSTIKKGLAAVQKWAAFVFPVVYNCLMGGNMRRALRECGHPGCRALTRENYCDKHKQLHIRNPKEFERESPTKRGYNYKWTKARKAFLAQHSFCECPACKESGHPLPANVVDHIVPHRGNQDLFWDESNWQAMNKRCHDKKTARENGGFGNKIKA